MTMKEKLERALKTPDTVYQFWEMWVEHYPPHPTIKKRPVLGRLIDCRDGVLNIFTEKVHIEPAFEAQIGKLAHLRRGQDRTAVHEALC